MSEDNFIKNLTSFMVLCGLLVVSVAAALTNDDVPRREGLVLRNILHIVNATDSDWTDANELGLRKAPNRAAYRS